MKRTGVIGILVSLALIGCFSPWKGNEGNLIISFSGGGSGRSILEDYFPPNDDNHILNRLIYEITVSGNGSTIPLKAKGGDTIITTIAVGLWEVKVDAYIMKTEVEEEKQALAGYYVGESIPFATGKNSVDVKVGQNSVNIPMGQFFFTVTFETNGGTKFDPVKVLPGDYPEGAIVEPTKTGYDCKFVGWYYDKNFSEEQKLDWARPMTDNITLYAKWEPYEIGDNGPGGGKIFHVDPEGFIMTDTGETCHYLEAALIAEHYNLFSSYISINESIGTRDSIGTGRQNTLLILDNFLDSPAANFCKEYNSGNLNDWFLPSIGELEKMSNESRWLLSSSEYFDESGFSPTYYFYLFKGGRDSTDYNNFETLFTLPIRAF